jgi:hypothetical protein
MVWISAISYTLFLFGREIDEHAWFPSLLKATPMVFHVAPLVEKLSPDLGGSWACVVVDILTVGTSNYEQTNYKQC